MKFLEFLFVPTILFLTVVMPIWLTMHYRSVNRSSRSLSDEDQHTIEHMLVTVDKLTDRIQSLESILDLDHPDWRARQERRQDEPQEARG